MQSLATSQHNIYRSSICFSASGSAIKVLFARPPGLAYLYGSLEKGEIERKEKQRREKIKGTADRDLVVTKAKVMTAAENAAQSTKNRTEILIQSTLTQLVSRFSDPCCQL